MISSFEKFAESGITNFPFISKEKVAGKRNECEEHQRWKV